MINNDADLGNSCAGLAESVLKELHEIAVIYDEAGNIVSRAATYAGEKIEHVWGAVPQVVREVPNKLRNMPFARHFVSRVLRTMMLIKTLG